MTDQPLCYTPRAAADAVGLSESTIRTLIRENTLPAKYYGSGPRKTVLIRAADLQAWVDSLPDERDTTP